MCFEVFQDFSFFNLLAVQVVKLYYLIISSTRRGRCSRVRIDDAQIITFHEMNINVGHQLVFSMTLN